MTLSAAETEPGLVQTRSAAVLNVEYEVTMPDGSSDAQVTQAADTLETGSSVGTGSTSSLCQGFTSSCSGACSCTTSNSVSSATVVTTVAGESAAMDTSEGGGSGGDDAGLIAGIVVGVVGAIAVVVVAVVLFIKYRAGSNKDVVDLQELDLEGNNKDAESAQTGAEELTAPLSPKSAQAATEASVHSQI